MLFQSWSFLIFLVPVWLLFAALRKTRLRLPLLLVAAGVFYASFSPWYLILLAAVILVDYGIGRALGACTRGRRWLVTVSIIVDMGLLAVCKYLPCLSDCDWTLPVGLSFFTFKSLSYVIDVYRGKLRPERNLLAYAAYVSFFPQLVAGPIQRAGQLLPQLRHRLPIAANDLADGLSQLVSGLFKKIILADMLALTVAPVYDDVTAFNGAARLLAAYAFAWQIYFDFSGYSDMACGVARLFGFRCALNFDHPYASVDVRDFWRRWHISLSTWFRDYLFIPLGGSRCGKLRSACNVLITMLVSGAWHGAAWTFVAWGGLNGLGSVVSAYIDRTSWYTRIPKIIRQLAVFHFMTVAWVFFRAASFADAFDVLRGICVWESEGDSLPFPTVPAVLTLCVWIYGLLWTAPATRPWLERRPVRIAVTAAALLCLLLLGGGPSAQFIYQQF